MINIWVYSILSVVIVSLISLVGLITFTIRTSKLHGILFACVAFAAGSLFGDVFFHLLPEYIEQHNFGVRSGFIIMTGIVSMLLVEKFIHWHHCHLPSDTEHTHPFAIMNLVGDAFHNLIDGIVIAASYLVSIPVGIATTIAVVLHEIPQEVADFGVLIRGGFNRGKALFYNFLSGLAAVIGVIIALTLTTQVQGLESVLVPFTIGTFLYIAGSDLIPEIHKELNGHRSFVQLISFVLGMIIMMMLLLLE